MAAATGLRHVNVGDLVKREQLHNGWDDEFECLVIDEDKVGIGWSQLGAKVPRGVRQLCGGRLVHFAAAGGVFLLPSPAELCHSIASLLPPWLSCSA